MLQDVKVLVIVLKFGLFLCEGVQSTLTVRLIHFSVIVGKSDTFALGFGSGVLAKICHFVIFVFELN